MANTTAKSCNITDFMQKIVIVKKDHCQIETSEYQNVQQSQRQFCECQVCPECPGDRGMVSSVHYVDLVQPLTTSLIRLIIGGTLSLASPPT
jgi:hypothetical protein